MYNDNYNDTKTIWFTNCPPRLRYEANLFKERKQSAKHCQKQVLVVLESYYKKKDMSFRVISKIQVSKHIITVLDKCFQNKDAGKGAKTIELFCKQKSDTWESKGKVQGKCKFNLLLRN